MNSGPRGINWDEQPLGEVHDRVLAERLGCTPQAVYSARKARGIPPSPDTRPAPQRCDPAAFAHRLGQGITDRDLAEELGLSVMQIRWARAKAGIPSTRRNWNDMPLGSVPDRALADKHGVDNKTVANARWRRGIGKWREERCCPCGTSFVAVHRRQRFCCYRCQRYHWQLVHRHEMSPEAADLAIALWAYKRTLKDYSKGTRTPCGTAHATC
jgi:hypothetical protein